MNSHVKALAVGLAFCVGLLPIRDLTAVTPPSPEAVKEQLNQYGVGANLKLKLIDGKKVKGSLVSLGNESFELQAEQGQQPRLIAYNNVGELRPTELVYRAKGAPDAVEARRVVLGLGVGHHIQVKTTTAEKMIHGNIQSIAADSFTMLPDRTTSPVEISFSQVGYIEQNLSKGAKIAIAIVIIAAVTVGIIAAAGGYSSSSSSSGSGGGGGGGPY